MAKDIVKYERALSDAGFRLVRNGKHAIWRRPDGRQWAISRNTNDGRGLRNLRSALRRLGVEVPR